MNKSYRIYPGSDKPSEAVIPSSITAGKESTYGRLK
jgi:hypothetical protein